MDPFTLLDWVEGHDGDGVQFSEIHLPPGMKADAVFLRELGDAFRSKGMYLEWGGGQHVPFDTSTWIPKDLLGVNRLAAEQAQVLGADVIRSCSGGFFRWQDDAPPTETLITEMAKALRPQRELFEELEVTLAIELHFEFTTFELLRLFELCEAEPGGWLGICLDIFNMLPMLEDPVAGTERILPWVVATHVKDGGLAPTDDGFLSFPTAVGQGVIDLHAVLSSLLKLDRPVTLSLEEHGGSFVTPYLDEEFRPSFPDLTNSELDSLKAASREGQKRMNEGGLEITQRERWPALCEERTRVGLANLRKLAEEFDAEKL